MLWSKDIINLVIGVIGSLLIFLFNNSFFDVKDDVYRFEHRGRKIVAIFFSISILGCFSYIEISQIFDFIIHNIYIDLGNSIEPLLIGFDEIYQEDVVSMKENIDLDFKENIEIVHMLHDCLIEHSYFNVLPTLMKRLKKDLEKHLNIEVLLFKMDD